MKNKVVFGSLFFIMGVLLGEEASPNKKVCHPLHCTSRKEVTWTPQEVYKMGNPTFYVAGAYTYWTASEEGTDLVFSNSYDNGVVYPITQGVIVEPVYQGSSGFQVALGCISPYDHWDGEVKYTWFNHWHPAFLPFNTLPTTAVASLPSSQLFGLAILEGNGRFRNTFNRIDLTFGKNFSARSNFSIRPFLGLLGAWEQQILEANYTPALLIVVQNNYASSKQKWWNIGPYAGFDNELTLYKGCSYKASFFANTGFSLGWGKFTTTVLYQLNKGEGYTIYCGKDFNMVSPLLELVLGLRGESSWRDRFMTSLEIGWQLQAWFNHNQMIPFLNNPGSMYLQGLTVKAAFGF